MWYGWTKVILVVFVVLKNNNNIFIFFKLNYTHFIILTRFFLNQNFANYKL